MHSTSARPVGRQVILWVFAVSGFVSLALEVVWFRVLTLFLRPTVYAYGVMLAMVLAGIALGSAIAAAALRRQPSRDWLGPLAWIEAALALTALLSLGTLQVAPRLVASAGPVLSPLVGDYLAYQIIVSMSVVLPPMLLFGAAFPLGLHLWAGPTSPSGADRTGTDVGVFYSLNVLGAIVGSLASGSPTSHSMWTTGATICCCPAASTT